MVPQVPKEPSNGVYKGNEASMGKGGKGILGCIGLWSTVGNNGIPPMDIFLWLPRVERIARTFLAFLLLSLFCASGRFSRVPDAMELSV